MSCLGLAQTMLTWYELYRSDGLRPARKIKVGLPDEALRYELDENGQCVDFGHAVPEADREVSQVPSAFIKENKIAASYDCTPRLLKVDLQHSQPSNLLEADSLKKLGKRK